MKPGLLLSLFAGLVILPVTAFAQIHVILSGGFRVPFDRLLPAFEQSTGIRVTTTQGISQGSGPDSIGAQLRRGAVADVLIMSKGGFDELLSTGKVARGAVVDIATVQLGVAVRVGAMKPDVSSVAAFRHALLAANSVASDSTAALYLENVLLPRLGIAAEIEPKFVDIGPPSIAIKEVALVIDPISAVANTPGADYVGALPAEIQFSQIFSAAVVSGSREQQAARRLVAFLQTTAAHAAIAGSGMQPIE